METGMGREHGKLAKHALPDQQMLIFQEGIEGSIHGGRNICIESKHNNIIHGAVI